MRYRCPCLTCPRCGTIGDEDRDHPIDGLAGCPRCPSVEWWAHSGPHMDGRHPMSRREEAAWRDYDTSMIQ